MKTYRSAQLYNRIAVYYDHMMDHVDYAMWAKYINSLFAYYGIKARRVIELSCGTGNFMRHFPVKKRILIAGDRSLAMLRRARDKNLRKKLPLFCADARQLPFAPHIADAALFLYDSMNYLLDDRDVLETLAQVLRILKPGGIFIFDVVTPYICRKEFMNYHETHVQNGAGYERHGWFNDEEQTQYNEFVVYQKGKTYVELHRQKIRSLTEWDRLIEQTPLRILGRLGDFSFRAAHPRSERVHYICGKK